MACLMKKNISILKREVLLGPFTQGIWEEWDNKYGGMENRPKYLVKMVEDHMAWRLNFSEIEKSKVNIVSVKPLEDSLDSPFPTQLRVTVMTSEEANLFLMRRAISEGQFAKRHNKAKIMLLDEFQARHNALQAYATLKKATYAKENPGAKMLTFITYDGLELQICAFYTNIKKQGWR